eukprot:scaffold9692_cov96-Isochrysis_galbana.AAC.5
MLLHLLAPLRQDGGRADQQGSATCRRRPHPRIRHARQTSVMLCSLSLRVRAKAGTAHVNPPAAQVALNHGAGLEARRVAAKAAALLLAAPLGGLALPARRRRKTGSCRRRPRVGKHERQHLDRLAQPHLVRQDAAAHVPVGRGRLARRKQGAGVHVPVDDHR